MHLTVAPVALGVLELPGVTAASLGVVVTVALVDTAGLLAGSGETTALAVLKEKKDPSTLLAHGPKTRNENSPCGRTCRSS